jgi:hypothetical protein
MNSFIKNLHDVDEDLVLFGFNHSSIKIMLQKWFYVRMILLDNNNQNIVQFHWIASKDNLKSVESSSAKYIYFACGLKINEHRV